MEDGERASIKWQIGSKDYIVKISCTYIQVSSDLFAFVISHFHPLVLFTPGCSFIVFSSFSLAINHNRQADH